MIPIITIDGPSGTGKGTITYMLARHLGWHYLDSGLIYRVMAYIAGTKGINFSDIKAILALIKEVKVEFITQDEAKVLVLWDGKDVYDLIRTQECGQAASRLGSIPEVRQALLAWQREFAKEPGLVTDGRDMGTVVFPKAQLKIFLDASEESRANRRYLQLKAAGKCVSLDEVLVELIERDHRDMNRSCAPLRSADDAYKIDTSAMNIQEVFNQVLALTKTKILKQ